ncbi:hypothetical protein RvY_17169 [Ramazzottius varieornatus]|uniref:G-protein coupled receptors family 1 profile domain-containing protein n=1 Tax=Ramazzottius varieornatus TaxID=947166 RepID=A0A1D1W3J5_RAMVA|nr:hypothetical protein RvY_17169 [Ramazzottius varieornatus]
MNVTTLLPDVLRLGASTAISVDQSLNQTEKFHEPPFSFAQSVLLGIFSGLFAIVTAGGNILVMLSLRIDKQLRTITNYFLLSLAFADLMIGLISMPLFTLYFLLGYWPLGPVICDSWLAADYLMSNASVLNLLIISFDRYLSITRPLTYRARRTTRRAVFMIAAAWIISLILWPPWIFAWPHIEGERKVKEDQCYIQFLGTNPYITVGTALAAFYVPATVMTILYIKIWNETQQRQRDLEHLTAGRKTLAAPQISLQKSTSSSDEIANQISPAQALPRKASATLSVNDVPAADLTPRPLWRRLCHCCKIDRDPVDYIEDESTDEMDNANTAVTTEQTTSRLTVNRINPVDKAVLEGTNGSLAPLMQTRAQMLNDPTIDSETYTILITFPEAVVHLSNRPVIEEMRMDSVDIEEISIPRSRMPSNATPSSVPSSLRNKRPSQPAGVLNMTLQQAQHNNKSASKSRFPQAQKKRWVEKKQDKKAAKTLSAILFAFIITWTPYNVFVLINAFSPDFIPELLFNISYYLCYINSTVNPICYALCNANFRKTYVRILCCRQTRNNSSAFS